jgi:hypothetical protein
MGLYSREEGPYVEVWIITSSILFFEKQKNTNGQKLERIPAKQKCRFMKKNKPPSV